MELLAKLKNILYMGVRATLNFRKVKVFVPLERRLFEGGAYLKILPDKFTFSIFLFNGTLSIC